MGESIREWCKTHVKVVITNKYLNADFVKQELVALVLLFVILLAGGGIFRAIERDAWQMSPNLSGTPTNLTFIDSVYWATVTLTTIGMYSCVIHHHHQYTGYGDITPRTRGGQAFTVFFIVIGIVIMASAVNAFPALFRSVLKTVMLKATSKQSTSHCFVFRCIDGDFRNYV